MNSKKSSPEDIAKIQDNLNNPASIENVIRCIRIAFESLHIPVSNDDIRQFIIQEARNNLESEHISIASIYLLSPDSDNRQSEKKYTSNDIAKIWKNSDNSPLIEAVIRCTSEALENFLNISTDPESTKKFIEQAAKKTIKTAEKDISIIGETPKKLEDKDFHINSNWWQEITLPDGIRVKINPEEDIIEFLDGVFKGEQHFSQDAALRETQKIGKHIPNNEDWKNIIRSINPDIDFSRDSEDTVSVHKILGLKLSGYQNGSTGPIKDYGMKWYYWTSSPNPNYGYYITASSTKIESINSTTRKHMFAVRCLETRIIANKTKEEDSEFLGIFFTFLKKKIRGLREFIRNFKKTC